MDDFIFTFNTVPFMNGVNTIVKGFKVLKDITVGFLQGAKEGFQEFYSQWRKESKKTNEEITKSSENTGKMMGAFTKRIIGLGAAYLGVRSIINSIPEIGRTFHLAGYILQRSFLWPLRKQLIPMLQKLLNWARNNRATLVKWGMHLANAFRVVVNIVKGVISLVKQFVNGFLKAFEGIFGKTTKRMSDIVNIIMFKITALIEFALAILKPVFEKLGALTAKIAASVYNMFIGIKEGFGDVSGPLGKIASIFERISNALFNSKENTKGWLSAMKLLGKFIGTTLKITIDGFIVAVDTMATSLLALVGSIKMAKAWFKNDPKGVKRAKDEVKQMIKDYWERTKGTVLEGGEAIRKILPGEEKTILERTKKTIPESRKDTSKIILKEENISPKKLKKSTREEKNISPKKPQINFLQEILKKGKPQSSNINVNVGDIQLSVTEGNAREAGMNFGKGIYESIHDQIHNALLGVAS